MLSGLSPWSLVREFAITSYGTLGGESPASPGDDDGVRLHIRGAVRTYDCSIAGTHLFEL